MPTGRLTVALSSLLLLILIGLPSSEAIKCLRGGTCYYRLGDKVETNSNFENIEEECPDACYSFSCYVAGSRIEGFGCENHLRTVCPIFTDAKIAELKNVHFTSGSTYYSFACKAGNCEDIFLNLNKTLEMLGPGERERAKTAVEVLKILNEKSNASHCHYNDVAVVSTAAAGAPSNAAGLHGASMILGWIMIGWLAVQFW